MDQMEAAMRFVVLVLAMVSGAAQAQVQTQTTCSQIGVTVTCTTNPTSQAFTNSQSFIDTATISRPFDAYEAGQRARDEEILRKQHIELQQRSLNQVPQN